MNKLIAKNSVIGDNGLLIYKDDIVKQYGNEVHGKVYIETPCGKHADMFFSKNFEYNK